MNVHNHGIDPSCREHLVGNCILEEIRVALKEMPGACSDCSDCCELWDDWERKYRKLLAIFDDRYI